MLREEGPTELYGANVATGHTKWDLRVTEKLNYINIYIYKGTVLFSVLWASTSWTGPEVFNSIINSNLKYLDLLLKWHRSRSIIIINTDFHFTAWSEFSHLLQCIITDLDTTSLIFKKNFPISDTNGLRHNIGDVNETSSRRYSINVKVSSVFTI